MNYINAINNFWSMNEVYSFSPTEIALYFYLLRVNNLCSWKQYFNHNNYKVMASINVKDLRTLSNARNKLKQAGLIDFRTRNGSAEANYSLFTSANYAEVEEKNSNYKSKTYAKNAEVSAQVSEQVYVEVSAEVFPSKDKLNKTKLNNNKNYTKNEVEEIYSLYPGKCVVKGSSTGKCEKNKDRIKKLLNTISADGIKRTIIWYIDDCKRHNTYMKNFSTFLNNIPEIPTSAEDRKCKWNTPNGDRVSVYSQFLIDQNRYGVDNVKFIGYAD